MLNPLSHGQWLADAIANVQLCTFCGQPLEPLTHTELTCPLSMPCAGCNAEAGEPCTPECLSWADDELEDEDD